MENGIDFDFDSFDDILRFKAESRRKLGIGDDEMLLLFVGQHILEKGVTTIIRAIDKLRDLPVKMMFVGTGYAVDEMKSLIKSLSLEDRIKLWGVEHDREKLKEIYAATSLFIFPSLYDNAPLVVREAAMMGVPSVLVNGSTAAEVIVDGENGFLSDNSVEGIASVVRDIYNDSERLRKASLGAVKTLTRSWKDVMEEVNERYNEIIERYGRF